MRAVDAAGEALYRADAERDETDPAQRRADAVGLMAQRALSPGRRRSRTLTGVALMTADRARAGVDRRTVGRRSGTMSADLLSAGVDRRVRSCSVVHRSSTWAGGRGRCRRCYGVRWRHGTAAVDSPSAASTSDEPPESLPDRRLLEQFFRELAGRAIDPDWRTNLPGFRHDHDIPWAIEAAAWEALEQAAEKEDADGSTKDGSDDGARRSDEASNEASSHTAAPDTMEGAADLNPADQPVDEAA